MGAAKGWVTTLADELQKVLRRKRGGRGARVFMDHQLCANEGLTASLRAGLRESRTLLLVMSPGYQRSPWCQWELARFLEEEAARKSGDGVFVVETDPTARQGWPRALQELIPSGWEREFEDRAPRLLGFPRRSRTRTRATGERQRAAHLIAERRPRGGHARAPRPRCGCGVHEDLLEERDSVAAARRQQGYEVIPAAPYPRDGAVSYLEALRRTSSGPPSWSSSSVRARAIARPGETTRSWPCRPRKPLRLARRAASKSASGGPWRSIPPRRRARAIEACSSARGWWPAASRRSSRRSCTGCLAPPRRRMPRLRRRLGWSPRRRQRPRKRPKTSSSTSTPIPSTTTWRYGSRTR